MKRKIIINILLLVGAATYGQKVIFLHHSTGGAVFSKGGVAEWISDYNSNNGTDYQVEERSYPNTPYPWKNYPYDYWNLWINNACDNTNPDIECMDKLTQDYDVIIYKHCFPGAQIVPDDGNPLISSDIQTIANYKLQYRALRALMDSYPERKFIVWTLAPLHRLNTNADNATRAREFVDWVKTSWLVEDSISHPNIYIFDFFGYAAESDAEPENGEVNCLKYEYEINHDESDSHPNLLANQTIGPLFAEFIVNTIEDSTINNTGVKIDIWDSDGIQVYPNPCQEKFFIRDQEHKIDQVVVYTIDGVEVLNYLPESGSAQISLDAGVLGSGIFILNINKDKDIFPKKLIIL